MRILTIATSLHLRMTVLKTRVAKATKRRDRSCICSKDEKWTSKLMMAQSVPNSPRTCFPVTASGKAAWTSAMADSPWLGSLRPALLSPCRKRHVLMGTPALPGRSPLPTQTLPRRLTQGEGTLNTCCLCGNRVLVPPPNDYSFCFSSSH